MRIDRLELHGASDPNPLALVVVTVWLCNGRMLYANPRHSVALWSAFVSHDPITAELAAILHEEKIDAA